MKEVAFIKFLDERGYEKLRIKIHTEQGKLVDVVVQYESFIRDKWTPIVRYDCSHGFFHRDVLFLDGEKEKQLVPISALKDALSYAE